VEGCALVEVVDDVHEPAISATATIRRARRARMTRTLHPHVAGVAKERAAVRATP
jgi:hypothetical protein